MLNAYCITHHLHIVRSLPPLLSSPSLSLSKILLLLQLLCFIARTLLPLRRKQLSNPVNFSEFFVKEENNSKKGGVLSIHAVILMAAPPVKSQPLHNFSLPHLKWAHKNSSSATSGSPSNHHRFRRRDPADQHRRSQPDPESDPENRPNPKQQQPPAASLQEDTPPPTVEEENGEAKPWKLRPRKEVIKAAPSSKKETGADNNDGKNRCSNSGLKSQRLRGMAEGGQQNGSVDRKAKRKVWISLSREEIEEDVYALTGGKPARRPKKWPKNVQKQLDGVFPGLYLVGVAADSYRVMMS